MPMRWFRKHQKKFLAFLAAFLMGSWLVGGAIYNIISGGGPGNKPVGEIFGKKITRLEFDAVKRRWRRWESTLRRDATFEEIRDLVNNQYVWEKMMFLHEADRLGITVTDKELAHWIKIAFGGGDEEGFDSAYYDSFLVRQNWTRKDFEETARANLTIGKLQSFIENSVKVSTEEARRRYKKENDQLKVKYVAFKPEDFADSVEFTANDIEEFYNEHKDTPVEKSPMSQGFSVGYKEPEKVQIEYIMASYVTLEDFVTVTDDEVREFYEQNKEARYRVPEPPKRPKAQATPTGQTEKVAPEPPHAAAAKPKPPAPGPKSQPGSNKGPAPKTETKDKAPKAAQEKANTPPKSPQAKPEPPQKDSPSEDNNKSNKEKAPAKQPETQSARKEDKNPETLRDGGAKLTEAKHMLVAEAQKQAGAPKAKSAQAKPKQNTEAPATKEQKKAASEAAKDTPPKAESQTTEQKASQEQAPAGPKDKKSPKTKTAEETAEQKKAEPAKPKYRPFEEVKDQIRRELTQKKAKELADKRIKEAEERIKKEYKRLDSDEIEKIDFLQIAKDIGLEFGTSEPFSERQARGSTIKVQKFYTPKAKTESAPKAGEDEEGDDKKEDTDAKENDQDSENEDRETKGKDDSTGQDAETPKKNDDDKSKTKSEDKKETKSANEEDGEDDADDDGPDFELFALYDPQNRQAQYNFAKTAFELPVLDEASNTMSSVQGKYIFQVIEKLDPAPPALDPIWSDLTKEKKEASEPKTHKEWEKILNDLSDAFTKKSKKSGGAEDTPEARKESRAAVKEYKESLDFVLRVAGDTADEMAWEEAQFAARLMHKFIKDEDISLEYLQTGISEDAWQKTKDVVRAYVSEDDGLEKAANDKDLKELLKSENQKFIAAEKKRKEEEEQKKKEEEKKKAEEAKAKAAHQTEAKPATPPAKGKPKKKKDAATETKTSSKKQATSEGKQAQADAPKGEKKAPEAKAPEKEKAEAAKETTQTKTVPAKKAAEETARDGGEKLAPQETENQGNQPEPAETEKEGADAKNAESADAKKTQTKGVEAAGKEEKSKTKKETKQGPAKKATDATSQDAAKAKPAPEQTGAKTAKGAKKAAQTPSKAETEKKPPKPGAQKKPPKPEKPKSVLEQGETNFFKRPKTYSSGFTSAYIAKLKAHRPEFARVAFELKKDEIGLAIEDAKPRACYLIKVTEWKNVKESDFDKQPSATKKSIISSILQEKKEKVMAAWKAGLEARANIQSDLPLFESPSNSEGDEEE